MIPIIISFISLILDGILTNYLPYLENDLSLFTPMFTLTILFIIYPFYRKDLKKYYITLFLIGIIYDLFYTNLLFFNAILFLIIGFISAYLYKNYEVTYIKLIIYLILIISIYELMTGLILFIFNLVPVTPYKVIYKITHSIILNIIYGELIFLILSILPKRFKKISIN